MDQATLDRLNAADDPKEWKTPNEFNYWNEIEAIKHLIPDMEKTLGLLFHLDYGFDDSSFFGDLYMRYIESVNPDIVVQIPIAIRFSKFGRLMTVRAISKTRRASEDIVQAIIGILETHGYNYVDYQSLHEPYTGCNTKFQKDIGFGQPTWYDRFFEYVTVYGSKYQV